MELKDRLRARLKALRISQSDLANRVGVSKGTVTFWMNGTNLIKGENLMAVARELECSPEWLISGVEPKRGASQSDAVMVELWYVRMKTAAGEYVILTENYASKRNAARKMRQIREDMGRDYVKKIDAGLV